MGQGGIVLAVTMDSGPRVLTNSDPPAHRSPYTKSCG